MATDPKKLFNGLSQGDVINIPGTISQLVVLKTRGEGGAWKHLGQVCSCGNHVRGVSRLFKWDDDKQMPVDKDGGVLDILQDVQVDKEASVDLAKKFEMLAVNDDAPSDDEVTAIFNSNPDFLKAIEIGHYSNADIGVTTVAMVRALGGTLSEEQAKLIAAVMKTNATVSGSVRMVSLSQLLHALSGFDR